MPARVLRLVPGGQRRRRCANCQVRDQRLERFETFTAKVIAAMYEEVERDDRHKLLAQADELGLRAHVEAELKKEEA